MPDNGIPKFPTVYSESEQARLEELKTQRKKVEEIYQQKFTPEAWGRVPLPEKAVREFLPSWLTPVVRTLTPWEEGTWDYGFTPEQVQDYRFELEKEYKEIARQEKVTRLLPSIQADLMIAALMGDPITDISQLLSDFPELRTDFTEEEVGYLSRMSQSLLHASPEEIISGKVFGYNPSQLPITQEDIDSFAKSSPGLDPRFILSSVAFSKDLQEIGTALEQAYPPEVPEVEVDEGLRQRLLDYFNQRNVELGLRPITGEPTQENIKQAHEAITKKEGTLLMLTDEESGQLTIVRKREDGSLWFGEDLVGYERDGKIAPVDMRSGEPLVTEEAQESAAKDLWDSFYLGMQQAWYGTKQALLGIIPQELLRTRPEIEGARELEVTKSIRRWAESTTKNLQARQDVKEVEFQEWMKGHPELAPRPEYIQNPIEHTELFKDPYFYAYTIISNAPIIGAALMVGVSTAVVTRNPLAGAVAGAAVITPIQINSVYEDLMANGASPENARELAVSVGTAMGAVEIIPGMIVLKSVSPVFMRIFKQNLQKELTKQVVKRLSIKGILATAGKIEVAETLEEVIQESMQNAAVKTVNENRSVFENIPQVAINTAIAVAPLALFGGGAEYMNMKSHLPKDTQDEIDTTTKKMEDVGLSHELAEAAAFSKVLDTETGQAEVEVATEKVMEEVPAPDKIAPRLEWLEGTLGTIILDLGAYEASIPTQEARLAKMKAAGELPSEQLAQLGTINDMKATQKELMDRKVALIKQIAKLRKATVKTVVSEAVIPLDEVSKYETRIPLELIRKDEKATLEELTKKIKEEGITEPITIRVREDGSRIVWDGIHRLIVAQNLKLKNIPVNFIGVKLPTVEPATMPEELIVPDPNEGRELTPDRQPRLKNWESDQEDTAEALKANRNIANAITFSEDIVLARDKAKLAWEQADEDGKKILTKEAGLKKNVIAKAWDDMSPPEQASLTLIAIPDGSLTFKVSKEVFDIRYYMQFLEEKTGLPFYSIFKRAELSHGAGRMASEKFLHRIGEDTDFDHIREDEEALARVAQEINAGNTNLRIEHPEGLTEQEKKLAAAITEIYRAYEPKVRYLKFMAVAPNMEAMEEAFPDAEDKRELAIALELRSRGELDGLYAFLDTCDWGVLGGYYDPWIVSHPTLRPSRTSLGTTRGAARLMRRETVDFPEGMEKNVLLRLATYIKQMEAQWRLEPELDVLEGFWQEAGSKFSNAGQVESALREWTRELQGIPTRQSFFDNVLRRVWRQAMSAVFLHPYMAFRNMHQALAFHPDRTELFKLLADHPQASSKEIIDIYYDSFVSQLKGIRRDWLYTGERGLPGLGWLTRLADKLSMYSHSDNIPRKWSFRASANKAMKATEQYKRDGDIKRWLKESGVSHLTQTERNYALQLLAQSNFDLVVPGLKNTTGSEMVSLYIGHEVANMTHFIYERAFRAPVEMGATGRTLFNLIVFPRGYFQRVFFQAKKMPNLKEVFSSEVDWVQARVGFKDVMLLVIVGTMISEWLKKVAGKRNRPYNPLDIIQWQLGGLVLGVGMDVTELIGDVITLIDPLTDKEIKSQILGSIPGKLTRQTDTLVPFYRSLLDSFEAFAPSEWLGNSKDLDKHLIRQLRAKLDEDYTPEELEAMDRNLWEKLRKAVLAGDIGDPTQFQVIRQSLIESQARLGEMDARGGFYTLKDFAGDIRTKTRPLPDDMLTEEYRFSDLVLFYKDSEDNWEELYELKTSPAKLRQEWRKEHVEVEARLLFWGMYSQSVFTRGSQEWLEVSRLLGIWFDLHGVDKRMHGEFADWTLPTR